MNSTRVFINDDGEGQEYITRQKLQNIRNRMRFLKECMKEISVPHVKGKSHPFPETPKCYLREGISKCIDEMETLSNRLLGFNLPHRFVLELRRGRVTKGET